jgi:hypothetical protein
MKAKNIEISKDLISFALFNDDDTPYMNDSGRPVVQTLGGWLNGMPTEYTAEDVNALIDEEMYKLVADMEKRKATAQLNKQKEDKIPIIKTTIADEILMTELPQVKITTKQGIYSSPLSLKGTVVDATRLEYVADGPELISGIVTPVISPFTVTIDKLSDGDYKITIIAGNKRGKTTDAIQVTIKTVEEVPDVPLVEEVPAVPLVEEVPDVPLVEEVPAVPLVEEVPAVPLVEEVPAVPLVELVPAVPLVEEVPAVPLVDDVEE